MIRAMAAYQADDYAKAVVLLQDYKEKATEPDPDALFCFCQMGACAPRSASGKAAHLSESINAFTTYLETVRPGDDAAQHELLKVYVQAGYIMLKRFILPTTFFRRIRARPGSSLAKGVGIGRTIALP